MLHCIDWLSCDFRQLSDATRPPSAVDSRCSTPLSTISGAALAGLNNNKVSEASGGGALEYQLPPVPLSKIEALAQQLCVEASVLHFKYEKERQATNEARLKQKRNHQHSSRDKTSGSVGGVKTRSNSFGLHERLQSPTVKHPHLQFHYPQTQNQSMLKATLSPRYETAKPRSKTLGDSPGLLRRVTSSLSARAASPSTATASATVGTASRGSLIPSCTVTDTQAAAGGLWVDCSSASAELSSSSSSFMAVNASVTAALNSGGTTTCSSASSSYDTFTPDKGRLKSTPVRDRLGL